MAAHPSLAGIATYTGLSGSTAWHNSVRARMYLKAAPGDDIALRVLECKKNNYGPVTATVLVRWKDGVYVVEPGEGSLEKLARQQAVEDVFITLLRRFTSEGRNVTDKVSESYAPARFVEQPEAIAAKVASKEFVAAIERLFAAKRIRVVPDGPPSKQRTRIIEVASRSHHDEP